MPNNVVVNTLNGFVEAIDAQLEASRLRNPGVTFHQNWYRGVSSVDHALEPTLFRVNRNAPIDHLNAESAMMQEFDRHAILRDGPKGDADKREKILKLFEMQHYGVPTRLLDWTTNPFVGLYFALSSSKPFVKNPAVWVCDPWAWNRRILEDRTWDDGGPAHVNDYAVEKYHPLGSRYDQTDVNKMEMRPVAVVGIYNSERMRAQRGVFTLFGKNITTMEKVYDLDAQLADSLFRIEIDKDEAKPMFEKLIQLGYTDSVAYPDFQGVALEIRRKFGHLT